jgi:hypothetical protein
VGLIYGPSGCGKSSLIKAGLLPLLARHVLPVYVEATPEETESRLLRGLRKSCPELPQRLGLVDSLAMVRKGRVLCPGQKVLIVLDQFEQWLHTKRGDENAELVAALRQCDGEHLQGIVMVRDDFWLAISRFMADLEIQLSPGQNIALVDLFAARHAKKVLVLFGQAYGTLPERSNDSSKAQHTFLDQAVSGLAQDGKIVPVRLALFSEMIRERSWTPATLHELGGIEGVGVTFLEETFSSAQAHPKHRLHQKAAQSVLKSLLPQTGTEIKGKLRSHQELLEVTGYVNRPRDFADLIHILDNDLRLITPSDPEGSCENELATSPGGGYYQLTHDYLVHSLRNWLTRKQRETRRGRAELRLAERSAFWNTNPVNRNLPPILEWFSYVLLTRRKDWNEGQKRMMRRAGVRSRITLYIVVLASTVIGFICFVFFASRNFLGREPTMTMPLSMYHQNIASSNENRNKWISNTLINSRIDNIVTVAEQIDKELSTEGYPNLIAFLRKFRETSHLETKQRLNIALYLLRHDKAEVTYVYEHLTASSGKDLLELQDALREHRSLIRLTLLSDLKKCKSLDEKILPIASTLARYYPDESEWEGVGTKVVTALIALHDRESEFWIRALQPARRHLIKPLDLIKNDQGKPPEVRSRASNTLRAYQQG